MSLETQIAALVTAANNLTGSVNGKLGEIDAALVASGLAYNAELNNLKNKLPRLLVTKNLGMTDADANNLPDNWAMHAEVSVSKLLTVSASSEALGRSAAAIALLAEIEADVREVFPDFDIRKSQQYRSEFTAWQYQWSALASPSSSWLAWPSAADQPGPETISSVPVNSFLTVGAFVKVVDGGLNGGMWSNGAQLGKWRWCSTVFEPEKLFGHYINLHPSRATPSGIVKVALAGACTGVVSHPGEWFSMMALSQ